jgi:DNA-binding LytR/AlgR family response regulator
MLITGRDNMKLILTQIEGQSELEVEIRYSDMDDSVKQLIKKIEGMDISISGNLNGRQYKIKIEDIFYIESVDKKTFIYGKEQVYRSELKLYQLLDKLNTYDFIQVSKSCILNINALDSIKQLGNSRIEAILSNGEKINVSRKYIPEIKKALSR